MDSSRGGFLLVVFRHDNSWQSGKAGTEAAASGNKQKRWEKGETPGGKDDEYLLQRWPKGGPKGTEQAAWATKSMLYIFFSPLPRSDVERIEQKDWSSISKSNRKRVHRSAAAQGTEYLVPLATGREACTSSC